MMSHSHTVRQMDFKTFHHKVFKKKTKTTTLNIFESCNHNVIATLFFTKLLIKYIKKKK